MTALLALLLLLAPAAGREPVGGADTDMIEDPLERRVASLLAGAPVFSGIAAVVPLYARVPSEAGHGQPGGTAWAGAGLRARFLVEDKRGYLRVANPRHHPVFLAAGTVFALDAMEVAVVRDAVIPGDFAALVPAAALGAAGDVDLALAGVLPPLATGSLLAGMQLQGEDRYVPVLESGVVEARRDGLASVLAPILRGFGGTAVGAVFLVGDRPVAAHVFGRHDLFLAALPDLLTGFAVEIRDDELRRPAAARRRPAASAARSRALLWLRGIAQARAGWFESYGAGFETVVMSPTLPAIGHAVADQDHALLHAGFYAIPLEADAPPTPPDNPGETPTGVRQTVEDQRREAQNRIPGPPAGPGPAAGPQTAGADPVPAPLR